jgi:2-isopropylmalate synthase
MQGLELTVADKLSIIRVLDRLGVQFIEGGYPASNPAEIELFAKAKQLSLVNATVVAFGMTCHKGKKPAEDKYLPKLVSSGAEVVAVVGKSSEFQVKSILETDLDENLRMIKESCAFLVKADLGVFFDAEHFFDGFKENPDYALACLKAAEDGGASRLILCDTNGGCLPSEIGRIVGRVKKESRVPVGIHTHNDSGLAVANSLAAVEYGAIQVQGTVNGYGERCGNADLLTLIATLQLKMGIECLLPHQIAMLSNVSRFVSETCNLPSNHSQPYVGDNAFTHKGGMHGSGHAKSSEAYQHIDPNLVGNCSHVVVSDLAGRANIKQKAAELGLELSSDEAESILMRIEELKTQGVVFGRADASFEILIHRQRPEYQSPFEILYRRVRSEEKQGKKPKDEAIVCIRANGGKRGNYQIAMGNDGPVDALDGAIRKALRLRFAKVIKGMRLVDYRVRTVSILNGTRSLVRVLIDFSDGKKTWTTVGASRDIIGASCHALSDGYEYAILKAR